MSRETPLLTELAREKKKHERRSRTDKAMRTALKHEAMNSSVGLGVIRNGHEQRIPVSICLVLFVASRLSSPAEVRNYSPANLGAKTTVWVEW